MGKVIAVSTNKGGSGKTSLTTNLAAAIATKHKKKVLIIDIDGQGNASLAFGLNPIELKTTIYDVLVGDSTPEEAIVNVGPGVDILPSNSDMDFFDIEVLTNFKPGSGNPFFMLKEAMGRFQDNYDYVFIDTPPSLGLVVGSVLVYADEVIVPFVPEVFDVKGLVRLLETIKDFKKKHNPRLSVRGVVGTMVDSRTNLHTEMLQQAKDYLGTKDIQMYQNYIPRTIRFASATAYTNMPAVWSDKSNAIVGSYFKLAKEIIKGDD